MKVLSDSGHFATELTSPGRMAVSWKGCKNEYAPTYDLMQFSKFEAMGCVFLPCTGFRPAYSGDPEFPFLFPKESGEDFRFYFNTYGRYWTSDKPGTGQIAVYPANISFEAASTLATAESVRLVKDVVSEQ